MPHPEKGGDMLDICNNALSFLGQENISSVDEENERARKCKQFYEICRKSLLRVHDWNFTHADISLTKISQENLFNKLYSYLYPTDCTHINKIYISNIPNKIIKYEIGYYNGNKIISCDELDVKCLYTKDVTDTSLFDSTFREALSYFIASKIAMALTGDTNLLNIALKQYEYCLAQATLANKEEEPEEADDECSFIEAR